MTASLKLFHALWTKAVKTPGYDKSEWMRLEAILLDLEHRKVERRKA